MEAIVAKEPTLGNVLDEIKQLRKDVNSIKEYLNDSDYLMTEDDIAEEKQAMADLKEGKTTSLKEMKKKLGI